MVGFPRHHLRPHMDSHLLDNIITRTTTLLAVLTTDWVDLDLSSLMGEDMEGAQERTTIDFVIENIS